MHRPLAALAVGTLLALPLTALLAPAASADAEGCAPGVASDFNGDGRADAAVADPDATVAGAVRAGRVVVLYGDADARVGEGARGTVRQGTGSVLGSAEVDDRFGAALATADLDCDGYTDLVVGTPGEDVGSAADAGLVQVVWGDPGGLGAGLVARTFGHDAFGYPVHAGDRLGSAVDALEDVGQGGTPAPDAFALAVGAPGWDVGGAADAGWAGFVVANDGGTMAMGVTQASPGIAGAAEAGDRFGSSVALGQLVGDGTVDAVVGSPGEDVGALADAGALTVLASLYDEPTGTGLDQGSPGVPGAPEAGDRFGSALDAVRTGSTTRLAVGVPREDVGRAADAGAVQLFRSGADLVPGASLSQDTAGVAGAAEAGDRFGEQVALAAPAAGVPGTRLVVGVPGEDGAAADTGLVQVLPVADPAADTSWTQASPGVPGTPQAGDRFGTSVAVVTGPTEQALLVGVPRETTGGTGVVDVLSLGGSAGAGPRAWVPGAGGVPADGADRFGAVVAGGGQP
ncbi:hypothetical protein ACFFOM_18355 [Microlunatus capsulatus]|uniref:FG-GAP repeat-containing protein n=1 Tax=Microlunatus capsulatus TaxID=99117 RepID=A0ABS4ZD70_9ACTN|nr:FG-GAP repeat protein [Microlunatus capsulatus]MBP2418969.1 hypothetical protein [Microlunatus capsulatus]